MKYTWLDFIWGANLQFGGLEPPKPMAGYVPGHMGSHSVTCYPTQVNTPRLNPSNTVDDGDFLSTSASTPVWTGLQNATCGTFTCVNNMNNCADLRNN